jgi:carboxymethylenebutenolidase
VTAPSPDAAAAAAANSSPTGPASSAAAVTCGWVHIEPWSGAAAVVAERLRPPQPLPPPLPLRCWLAEPRDSTPRAGVLVLPEIFGINGWVRSFTDRLAAAGYTALAMPLFARTAPDLELGYTAKDVEEGRHHKDRTSAAGILLDGASACAWLERRLGRRGGLGCVGFCFGGHAALISALQPAIAATVDCYGAGVASGRPGGGPPSLELVPAIEGRLLCLCGRQDPLIPTADLTAIAVALAGANHSPPHRLQELEAGHGFFCEERPDYCPAAAEEGWQLLLQLFAESLG